MYEKLSATFQYGIDLSIIGDVIGGESEFDADFVRGSTAGLNEVTELIDGKLRELQQQQQVSIS
jgi:hypothetical protein